MEQLLLSINLIKCGVDIAVELGKYLVMIKNTMQLNGRLNINEIYCIEYAVRLKRNWI